MTKCLNPNCSNEATTRGLCPTCRATVQRLVASGKTTYEKLEAAGKILPKSQGKTTAWLLDETTKI